jgi:hypothetical protein
MSDLVSLGGTIADLTAATRDLPEQLRRSGLLFGPANQVLDPLDRLKRHAFLGAAPLGHRAAPDLQARWSDAAIASCVAAQATGELRQARARDQLRGLSI